MSQTINQSYGASTQTVVARKFQPLYAAASLGGLALIASPFLAWYNINLAGEQFTISGMGGLSGAKSSIATYLAEASGNPGVVSLFFGGLVLLMGVLGLLLNKKGFAIAGIVLALLGAAFTLLKITQATSTSSTGEASTSTGLGLYLGLAAALIALGCFVGAVVAKRR